MSFSATGLVEGATRGSRLDGLVVARDDMPSVVEQRNDLARFGVGILDSSTPLLGARRRRSSGSAGRPRRGRWGDVLVVVSERALGQTSDQVARTIRTLRRHTPWSRC